MSCMEPRVPFAPTLLGLCIKCEFIDRKCTVVCVFVLKVKPNKADEKEKKES